MRTKVTLVLVFLNVALFYVIFFVQEKWKPATDTSVILGPEVANIQSLTVTDNTTGATTALERRGEKWFQTQPLAWPANELAVRTIISELQFLRPISQFPVADLEKSGLSLATYGLEKPPLTLSFTPATSPGAPAPAPVLVRIGNSTDVSNYLYILSPDGTRIHVVPRTLAESLSRTLQSMRSDELFTIRVFEARSLNLEPAAGSRVRFRRENDKWFIEGLSISLTRANKQLTELALADLRALRVHSFVNPTAPEAEAARAALATPALRITIEGNNRRETLLLGPVAPAASVPSESASQPATLNPQLPDSPPEPATLRYALMETDETGGTTPARATLFTVSIRDKFLNGTLLNAQRELREKQILDLDPSTLSSITIASPQSTQELVLQRLDTSNAWQIVLRNPGREVQTQPADRSIVETLIASLVRLSVDDTPENPGFIDVASEAQKEEFGFNRPARTLTFTGPPAQPPVRLLIASSQDRRTYARLASQEYIYRISDEILRELPVDPLHYRERLLRELPASTTLTALKLTDLSNDTVVLDTSLPLPADTTLNREAIESLATQLRTLRAKNFTATEFTKTVTTAGEERGWKYRLDASLTSTPTSAPVTSTLFIADRSGGGIQLVGSPEFNAVFEAEQPLIEALFPLTYGPRDPGPPPAPAPTATPAP
ncbi:hypothetical protein CMV30_03960 [Nibricoccus aquaticus]|uniref:DUF4340 domain-containing protein n=1 Tax=Nibricoccus aquaticus TaxID=2576891 RepID=A0A290Q4F8_9BACT|nr:DUF4340 domain-containing protein [Nibricoccus aquaticus]ATC63177.1 hypothetical protein CMV30_03960 [Nibricoccus aquaticus]